VIANTDEFASVFAIPADNSFLKKNCRLCSTFFHLASNSGHSQSDAEDQSSVKGLHTAFLIGLIARVIVVLLLIVIAIVWPIRRKLYSTCSETVPGELAIEARGLTESFTHTDFHRMVYENQLESDREESEQDFDDLWPEHDYPSESPAE
jgi:hypothetical protein